MSVGNILFDMMAIHSWRVLPEDAACFPETGWVMIWISCNILSFVNLMIAGLKPIYSLIMLYINVVSYSYMVYYYMFMVIGQNNVCGTMFVALPMLIVGFINIYMVPELLILNIPEKPERIDVVDDAMRRIGVINLDNHHKSDSIRFSYDKNVTSPQTNKQESLNNFSEDTDRSGWLELSEYSTDV